MDQYTKATSTDCLYPSEQALLQLLRVDTPSPVLVDVVEHQLQLLLRQVLIDGEHHITELFVVHLVIFVYVEHTQ